MHRVLLSGPRTDLPPDAAYGGGMGGFVRNMMQYVSGFTSDEIELVPVYNSIRRTGDSGLRPMVRRLAADAYGFARVARTSDAAHLLGQYREGIYREVVYACICRLLRIPFIYEIKAGGFIDWIDSTSIHRRLLAIWILRRAALILCEGTEYCDFLQVRFGLSSIYHPNGVDPAVIPAVPQPRNWTGPTRVLFVGYCYEGKGVFDLIEGCRLARSAGLDIRLVLAGAEHPDFAAFLDGGDYGDESWLTRLGPIAPDEVYDLFRRAEIFAMPTKHRGEGHTNSINEAMALGPAILATRHGFLGSILDGCALFLEKGDAQDIANGLHAVLQDTDAADDRARKAWHKVAEDYSMGVLLHRLECYYLDLLC